MHHQCIIRASSAQHQHIISTSSAHHQCIISTSSVHNQCIISASSAHHQSPSMSRGSSLKVAKLRPRVLHCLLCLVVAIFQVEARLERGLPTMRCNGFQPSLRTRSSFIHCQEPIPKIKKRVEALDCSFL